MSVISLQRLTLGNCLDYTLGVGPIAFGFLAVPTLARAAGREPLEAWVQLPLSLPTLYMHFTHTTDAIQQQRVWTCLSCGVCHASAIERANSLRVLLLAGWQPATSLGALASLVSMPCPGGLYYQERGYAIVRSSHLVGRSLS